VESNTCNFDAFSRVHNFEKVDKNQQQVKKIWLENGCVGVDGFRVSVVKILTT